ncbi:MAG: hypothetical protein IT176_15525 [Acidobacteria bacterium]|nr:hypothetical protein [Acidobacteriota bacterium]
MVIDVVSDESTTLQVRAYAEFRFFTALARHAGLIRRVEIACQPGRQPPADAASCDAHVVLESAAMVRARARHRHVCGAIDSAAAQIAHLMRQPVAQTPSS